MSDFLVNFGSYGEVNQRLTQAANRMGTILDDLNNFLKNMGEATKGQAAPLWQEQQLKWTQAYMDMNTRLNTGARTSTEVANIFQEGDRRGANIMM
ncbi:WXG100 family type VII secretion target [Saccharopolyspora erythraea NRRL 2338]|uniref:Uncharacterized protein n=2 Tax=Saccharopolyspora erythraea TaxID=1836 RepID=A4FKY1_SACEN|nr:hypothetical protein [Saccharopolyspora erythraea]EQD82532.1 hypothetical protein N599_30160 [Saccharopolyspora erythraea D]PFG98346.1 WXG100 family type VII secretion target [Saccharopolyspora erythraea NRRL 2338]QRK88420.1 hypothetical protein JQX30_27675 [Saccharopolyspora erythraea]CAM04706.1 hypothetical protein SACE_5514 [Saccharopolyspora erythraea NRRL 2338]